MYTCRFWGAGERFSAAGQSLYRLQSVGVAAGTVIHYRHSCRSVEDSGKNEVTHHHCTCASLSLGHQ